MAARLFRLRIALLGGLFRGSLSRGLRAAFLLLLCAAGAFALAALPVLLVGDSSERGRLDIVFGGVLLALAFVVPLFENRRMLSARQFASYPASAGGVATSMLLTAPFTWSFLMLVVWLVSLWALRPEWREPAWAAPVALVLAALVAMLGARVAAGLSQLLTGERNERALRTIGVLLLVAALPVAVFAVTTALASESRTLAETSRVLAWTPFGAPFAGIGLAAAGDLDGALAHFAIAAAAAILLFVAWMRIVAVSNRTIERPNDPASARRGLGWFEQFSARPASVIAARELTYWSRDPRYKVALLAIPFAPFVMLFALGVAGVDLHALALIPLPVIMLMLGWSQHNDVAMDSTAIWMHVVSGTRGRADRTGRVLPVLLVGLPIALIGSSISVTLVGDWRILPAVLGMNIGVLCTALAASSVFSVLMPYPVTRPGDSPFVQPQWSGSGSGLSQTLSIATALLLAAPILWVSVSAIVHVEFIENMAALLVGVGYGLGALLLGIVVGGAIFDRSGPELVAVTQIFD